ncbi:MAG: hypothetical protein IKO93_07995, partial [Lentisphaeria bacterium]|nr:hypothetical protein [Lentisphaeria bacterium]
MLFLRTAAFYFVTALWWVVYWLAVLVPVLAVMFLLPDQRKKHYLRIFLLYFGLPMVRIVWRPFFKVRFEDRTGGSRKPGILIANHRSAIDGFLVSLPRRNMVQTVNGWPLRIPVLGWFALSAGYLNITGWDFETLLKHA